MDPDTEWSLIAGSYLGPEGMSSLLMLISLSASASSFHESLEMAPPGQYGYQLMVCLHKEITLTKLHCVPPVQ